MRALVVGLSLLATPLSAWGANLLVPQDYPDPAAALLVATWGDSITIQPGHYSGDGWGNLDNGIIYVVLRSEGGADVTSIDLEGKSLIGGIEGVLVEGLRVFNGSGGLIGTTQSPAIIQDCHFHDNVGRIVGNADASSTIIRTRFERNERIASGIRSWISLTDCELIDNTGSPLLNCNDGVLNLTRTRISGSTGIVMEAFDSPINVTDCEVENGLDSVVLASGGFGDAVSLTLVRSTFRSNHTTTSGAVARMLGGANRVTTEDCFFLDNTADVAGGVFDLSLGSSGRATWVSSTFRGNAAPVGSVALMSGNSIADEVIMERTLLAENTGGELLDLSPAPVVDVSCTNVFGNAAGDWVGVLAGLDAVNDNLAVDPEFCPEPDTPDALDRQSPLQNGNHPDGAACGRIGAPGACGDPIIWVVTASGTGDAPTIREALELACCGDEVVVNPGVYTWTSEGASGDYMLELTPYITLRAAFGADITILDAEGQGGVMSISGPGDMTLADFTLANGMAANGGGLRVEEASLIAENLILDGNAATNAGGGAHVSNTETVEFRQVVMRENSASMGGALYVATATMDLDNSRLESNLAMVGGGLYLDGTEAAMDETVFFENSAVNDGGGAYFKDTPLGTRFQSCTLVRNQSSATGGSGFAAEDARMHLAQTIVAFGIGGAAASCSGDYIIQAWRSDVFGNAGGDWGGCLPNVSCTQSNFSADPLFCDLDAGDLRLTAGSPCLPGAAPCPGTGLVGAFGEGCAVVSVDPADVVGPARVRVHPNPARGLVVIDVEGAVDASTRVDVFDVTGRRVFTAPISIAAGGGRVVWDGRNARGQELGAGRYYARVTTPTGTRVLTITRVP